MPTRFIGGVLSAQPQRSSQFLSRASTGTYFDSTGVMRTAPVNQPRLNYELVGGAWTNPQVLIEPASTNICLYSQDFTNAVWAIGGNTPTRTANFAVAPDGTTTATRIQLDRTSGNNWSEVMQRLTLATNPAIKPGVLYTLSIWLKANTGTPTIAYVYNNDYSTGANGTGTPYGQATLDSTWRRYTTTFISSTTITSGVGINLIIWANLAATSTTADILAWGAQIEQGSLTSYIPTTNVAVTRSEDRVASMGSGIYDLQDLYQNRDDNNYTTTSFTTVGETYWTAPEGVNNVEVLVVAGGGSGGSNGAGGGGGGVVYEPNYPVKPGQTYTLTVGAGGASVSGNIAGLTGTNSQFGNLIALGGGGGGSGGNYYGKTGGSAGGNPAQYTTFTVGISGQGFGGGSGGGNALPYAAGGGGGAGGPGTSGNNNTSTAGAGGPGLYFPQFSSYGASGYFGGGGGSGGYSITNYSAGGVGGGGAGASTGVAGTANTGGGGGGSLYGSSGNPSGAGGSGIVILRYRRQNTKQQSAGNLATVMQRFTRTGSTYLWFTPEGVNKIELLVVSGGGGGGYGRDHTNLGSFGAGGGGAGGVIYNNALTVNQGSGYQINVGVGGAGGQGTTGAANQGSNGSDSWFYTQEPLGGGGGGGVSNSATYQSGKNGGSGGGVAAWGTITGVPGTGYSLQGNDGGTALTTSGSIGETGGGGGGAGSLGQNASPIKGGDGGTGLAFAITGNVEYYAGGGGGGADLNTTYPGKGGLGGGGSACLGSSVGGIFSGEPGAPNTGGGGGAGSGPAVGGTGGSGVVVIRYQVPNVATFIESGSWTCPSGVYSVQALIVAGGGGTVGTSNNYTGGGGGGGVVYSTSVSVTPGVTYPVIVGAGGKSVGDIAAGDDIQHTSSTVGYQGENSSFAGIVAIGGGGCGASSSVVGTSGNGQPGGSGGGGTGPSGGIGGSGVYGQGNAGGASGGTTSGAGGGGGGAGQAGTAGSGTTGGKGGDGLAFSISGSSVYYGGGGGGSSSTSGVGGLGGGATANAVSGGPRPNGTPNTGGGAGGKNYNPAGRGGSGIVIIRWN